MVKFQHGHSGGEAAYRYRFYPTPGRRPAQPSTAGPASASASRACSRLRLSAGYRLSGEVAVTI
jgi:hypothetical protein